MIFNIVFSLLFGFPLAGLGLYFVLWEIINKDISEFLIFGMLFLLTGGVLIGYAVNVWPSSQKTENHSMHSKTVVTTIAGLFTAGSVVGTVIADPASSNAEPDALDILSASYTETVPVPETIQQLENYTPAPPRIAETEPVEEKVIPTHEPEILTIAAEPEPHPEPSVNAQAAPIEEPPPEPIVEQPSLSEPIVSDSELPAEDPISVITITYDDSSMTQELIEELEGIAVFWAPTGNKTHLAPTCPSFKDGQIFHFAGSLDEAQSVRTEGWCKMCADHLFETDNSVFLEEGNDFATAENLASSYTYNDYLNGVPTSAFND